MTGVNLSRSSARLAVAGLAAALALTGLAEVRSSAAPSGAGPRAVIRYTEYGIPHIIARDEAGLGYGYGYAVARDNLCVLADAYLTVDGRRSRYLGADTPVATGLGSGGTNLNSDLYFQRIKDSRLVERLIRQAPPRGLEPELVARVRGYVQGYNRYVRENHGAINDPACRGAAWVRPITDIDVYRHLYAVATIAGSGGLINGLVSAQAPAAVSAAHQSTSDGGTAKRLASAFVAARAAEGLGSNAIGVGSKATTSGGSVLLGNPHYPWQGPRRFWQAQLTIPGKFNVSGASLLGMPTVMIGHNADVAWSHTVSTAATFGLFEVQTVPGSPTSYYVDGKPEKMTSQEVSVPVRATDGSLATVQRKLWSTRYGPVITSVPGVELPWAGTVHALRDANATNLRALNTWFKIARARDTGDVVRALSRTQGLPWVNTIATDREGRALFADVQVVPNVRDELAARCSTPLGATVFRQAGIPILDGGRSDCAWGTDADAVEPGLLGPAALPKLVRDDYVVNANDSPWLSNPQAPLTYPRIVGDTGTARSTRTQEAILSVQRRQAGTDPLPGRGFSEKAMREILFADHSRTAQLIAADTATMCSSFAGGRAPSASGPIDVSTACPALAAWNHAFTVDSRGSLMFARFVARLGSVPGGPWRTPFDPSDPVGTPNTLATERLAVQQAFGNAAAELAAADIAFDSPLGAHQYVTRAGKRFPIHGAPNPLGVLNVITPIWNPTAGNTEVTHGSSFIQVVQFTRGEQPVASTLLTYSQSSDPTSRHFADQTRLFSQGRWVKDRFTEAEILKSPVLRIQTLR